MKIYAFLGRKRSGKDLAATITEELIKKNGTTIKFMSFAGAIKEALVDLTGAPSEYFYEQKFKEEKVIKFDNDKEFTPRELMVWYGMLMREMFGPNFWVNKVKEQIKEHDVDYLFITDVRFIDETTMLNDSGATIVYMDRDDILGPMSDDADISEKVVYESRNWAREHASDYVEISNNKNSKGYLTMHLKHSLNI